MTHTGRPGGLLSSPTSFSTWTWQRVAAHVRRPGCEETRTGKSHFCTAIGGRPALSLESGSLGVVGAPRHLSICAVANSAAAIAALWGMPAATTATTANPARRLAGRSRGSHPPGAGVGWTLGERRSCVTAPRSRRAEAAPFRRSRGLSVSSHTSSSACQHTAPQTSRPTRCALFPEMGAAAGEWTRG